MQMRIVVNRKNETHCQQVGFDVRQHSNDIKNLLEIANGFMLGGNQQELMRRLFDTFGDRFDFEEGNKRVVLVPNKNNKVDDFVYKINRYRGYEGILDNAKEYDNTEAAYMNHTWVRENLAFPRNLALIGDGNTDGLIEVQERVAEPMRMAAEQLGLDKQNITTLQATEIGAAFAKYFLVPRGVELDNYLLAVEKFMFIDDWHKRRSSKNIGINKMGKICMLDLGSCLYKYENEARCSCGGILRYTPEDKNAVIGTSIPNAHKVVAMYVCENDQSHQEHTGPLMQQITADMVDNFGKPQSWKRVAHKSTFRQAPPVQGYYNSPVAPPLAQSNQPIYAPQNNTPVDRVTAEIIYDARNTPLALGSLTYKRGNLKYRKLYFANTQQIVAGYGYDSVTRTIIKV